MLSWKTIADFRLIMTSLFLESPCKRLTKMAHFVLEYPVWGSYLKRPRKLEILMNIATQFIFHLGLNYGMFDMQITFKIDRSPFPVPRPDIPQLTLKPVYVSERAHIFYRNFLIYGRDNFILIQWLAYKHSSNIKINSTFCRWSFIVKKN